MEESIKYKRVILKLSGEAMAGKDQNIDFDIVRRIAEQVVCVTKMGIEVGIIVGGGNIWRGRNSVGIDRVTGDHMGMLATVINGLALQNILETLGAPVRLMTAIEMRQIAEPYIRRRAMRHVEKGRIVIFACGTGNPYFTTDTATALRAADMEADLILLAKNVDGVYDRDPKIHKEAVKFEELAYLDVISKGLEAMDKTSITLCMENKIPILAFALEEEDSIIRAVSGEKLGTYIH